MCRKMPAHDLLHVPLFHAAASVVFGGSERGSDPRKFRVGLTELPLYYLPSEVFP